MRSYAVCSAFREKIIILELVVFVEYQRVSSRMENWSSVCIVGVGVAPLEIN